MNEIVAAPQPTKLDKFFGAVVTPTARAELKACLPKQISIDRFERNLKNALMQNPELLDLPTNLVWREVAKAASLGLLLDPQLQEGAIIVSWNGKAQRKEPQFRAMVRGLTKLCRQSGEISKIWPREVCEADSFEVIQGLDEDLIHKPNYKIDRGPRVLYYAVAKYANGETDFEVMTRGQIDSIRDDTEAYKAFVAGRIKSTPWATGYDEMAKKTVMRRLMKRLPQSPDLADLLRQEDAQDFEGTTIENEPVRLGQTPEGAPPRPVSRSQERRLAAQTGAPTPDFSSKPKDVTGEFMEAMEEAALPGVDEDAVISEEQRADIVARVKSRMAKRHEAPEDEERPADDAPGDPRDVTLAVLDADERKAAPEPVKSTTLPMVRAYPLGSGQKGLDWQRFRNDLMTAANLLKPEQVGDLESAHADALDQMKKSAFLAYERLRADLAARRTAEVKP